MSTVALRGRHEARSATVAGGVDALISVGNPPERLLAALVSWGRQDQRAQ